jgi:hypothetical protein
MQLRAVCSSWFRWRSSCAGPTKLGVALPTPAVAISAKEVSAPAVRDGLFLRLGPNAVALSSHAAPPLPRCRCAEVTCQMQEQQEHHQQQPPPSGSNSVPVLTSRALSIAQRVAGYAGEDPDELRSNSSIDDLLPEVRCAPALEHNLHCAKPRSQRNRLSQAASRAVGFGRTLLCSPEYKAETLWVAKTGHALLESNRTCRWAATSCGVR